MPIKTKSLLKVGCRKCNEVTTFAIDQWQFEELSKPRRERMLMQDIFPELSIGDRELIISQTCNTCWQAMFPIEEE